MSRRPCSFRESDVKRAIRAARSAGIEIARVEIDPSTGRIIVIADAPGAAAEISDLDQWKARHAR
jgi:hypothetical protein